MTEALTPEDPAREQLSALMDGELDPQAVAAACMTWRENIALRAAWHEYQLIGDVLRSSDLATPAHHDAAFLHRLREHLADEPVVLAPMRPSATPPAGLRRTLIRRAGWVATSAAAAGFVAVVAFGVMGRSPGSVTDRAEGPRLARGVASGVELAATVPQAAVPSGSAELAAPLQGADRTTLSAGGSFVRDARLDRYLEAHQEFAGSSALGVPSAFLRSATLVNAADH